MHDVRIKRRLVRVQPRHSSADRATAAREISQLFRVGRLNGAERAQAEDIFEILAHDIAEAVRETLALELCRCPFLPRRIAQTLAADVERVALPVVEFSEVLTEDDLRTIIRSRTTAKQLAVARRRHLPERASDALVETGNKAVVIALLSNDGARVGTPALHRILDRFGHDEAVQEPLVRRRVLPAVIAERLVTLVSEALLGDLVARHELPPSLAAEIAARTRENAVTELVLCDADPREIGRLAARLNGENRLTPTLLLLALCTGNVTLFEAGVAVRADIPIASARALIADDGPAGFRDLYRRADLPAELFPAFRAAVDVVVRDVGEDGTASRERRMRRIVDRLLLDYDDIAPGELETAMYQLQRHMTNSEACADATLVRLLDGPPDSANAEDAVSV